MIICHKLKHESFNCNHKVIVHLVPKMAPDYYLVFINVYQFFLADFKVPMKFTKTKINVFEKSSKQTQTEPIQVL
jgi:hypothetical protein